MLPLGAIGTWWPNQRVVNDRVGVGRLAEREDEDRREHREETDDARAHGSAFLRAHSGEVVRRRERRPSETPHSPVSGTSSYGLGSVDERYRLPRPTREQAWRMGSLAGASMRRGRGSVDRRNSLA